MNRAFRSFGCLTMVIVGLFILWGDASLGAGQDMSGPGYSQVSPPFVDPATGRVVPLELPPAYGDFERWFRHRQSTWELKPAYPGQKRLSMLWQHLRRFWARWRQTVERTLIVLLIAGLLLVVWGVWRLSTAAFDSSSKRLQSGEATAALANLLPEGTMAREVDLWQAAGRCYDAGDLRGAVIYLYCYVIVVLHQHGLLRALRGKTCRDYGKELHVWPSVQAMFQSVADIYEQVYFGQSTASATGVQQAIDAAACLRAELQSLRSGPPELANWFHAEPNEANT